MPAPRTNDEFLAFARRILAAYGRRVADGDVEALVGLRDLAAEVDAVTASAVTALRSDYSCAEIGARLGISRQAVSKRWPG